MIENGSIEEGRKASTFVEKYSCDNIVDKFEVEIKRLKLKEDLRRSTHEYDQKHL